MLHSLETPYPYDTAHTHRGPNEWLIIPDRKRVNPGYRRSLSEGSIKMASNCLPPADQTMPILHKRDSTQDVVCSTKLGGLLKTYYRRAAQHGYSIAVE